MPRPAPSSSATADRGPPVEALAGLVERVTFHNAETGFCVLRVKARGQRELVTVVGHAATIASGEWVQMNGSWINDRTHGLQFKAAFLKAPGIEDVHDDWSLGRSPSGSTATTLAAPSSFQDHKTRLAPLA